MLFLYGFSFFFVKDQLAGVQDQGVERAAPFQRLRVAAQRARERKQGEQATTKQKKKESGHPNVSFTYLVNEGNKVFII